MKKIYFILLMIAASTTAFSQTLTISEGSNNHAASNESGNAQNVEMLQLQLSADNIEDIVISTIRISPTASGLIRNELIDPEIRIYRDVNNNGVYESSIDELIATDNYVGSIYGVPHAVNVSLSEVIYAGTTENWLVLHSFSGGDNGNYIEISISQNNDITAAGDSSGSSATVSGAPVNGNRKTVSAVSAGGNLFLGEGGFNTINRNIEDGADDEIMLQVTLTASSLEDIDISEISFDMSGSGNESVDLNSVKLYNDLDGDGQLNIMMDVQIGATLSTFVNNGSLVFSGLSETINAGGSENWIVVYDFDASETSAGETYQTTLTNNSDVNADGHSSSQSITPSGAPISGGLATISTTGTLTLLEGVNNPAPHTANSDEQNLAMLQLELAAGATEAVNVSSISFSTYSSINESTDLDSARLFLDANGNGQYDISIDSQIGSTISSFTDNGSLTFSSLSEQISAAGSENWLVVYYLNGTASTDETFRVYLNDNSDVTAAGATSANSITPSGAPVQGNSMTISTIGALTVSLGANDPGAENINGAAQNVTMLQLKLEASAVEDIQINSIKITPTGNGLVRTEIVDPEIRIYRDVNNNGVYESATDELITTANYGGSIYGVPPATTVSLSEVIYAGTSENWLIVHTYNGGDVDNYLEIGVLENSDISGTGLTSSSSVGVTGASVNGGRKTVVSGTTPGTLSLSVGGEDPGYRNVNSSATDEVMFQLLLSAGSNEAVEVSSVTFATTGSADESTDLTSALLYEDVDNNGQLNVLNDRQIGSTLTSFTDNGNLVFNGLSEIINAGNSENWLVVYNLNGSAVNGETFQVLLEGNAAVVDTGVSSGEPITTTGAPLESGVATISAIGSLTQGSNNPEAHNITDNEQDLVMLQINLAANATEAINISSLSITTTGTANESTDLDSIKLFNDADNDGLLNKSIDFQIGSTVTSFTDNCKVTFSSLTEQIPVNDSENWLVVYYLNGNASNDETFRVYIDQNSDLTATGATSGSSVTPSGAPVNGNPMTVSNVGALTIALGANDPSDENINGAAQNVTMLQLNLTASSVEDIQINSILITPTGSGLVRTEIVDPEIRIYRDVNNNGVYESAIDELITTADYGGSIYGVPPATTVNLSEIIYAGTSKNWLILHSYSGGDVNDYLEIGILQNIDINCTGITSSQSVSVTGASIQGGRKTVVAGTTPGTLTLSVGGDDPGYRNIATDAANEVMFQMLLSAGSNEAVEISSVTFAMAGSGNESADLTSALLYEDVDNDGQLNVLNDRQIGNTLTSFTDNGNLVFNGISEIIDAGNSENWLVVYNLNGSASNGETFQVEIEGNGAVIDTGVTSGEPITTTGAPLESGIATVSLTGALSLSAGGNNPAAHNIEADEQNLVMLQLNLSASTAEAVDISSIVFTTSGTAAENTDIDSAKLYIDINNNGSYDFGIDNQIGSTITSFTDNGTLTFSSLSEQVSAGENENWLVIYYLSDRAKNDETFRVYLNQNTDVTATGATSSNSITPNGAPVQGSTMTVSGVGTLTMSLGANDPGNENINGGAQNVTMLQLNLSASSAEDIQINSILITPTGSGLVRTEIVDPEIRIYRDVNNNGVYESAIDELITTANYGGSIYGVPPATTVSLSEVIYAGTSENWLIVHTYSGGDVDDYLEIAVLDNGDISGTGISSAQSVSVTGASIQGGRKTIVSGTVPGTLSLSVGGDDPGYRNLAVAAVNEVMFQMLLSAGSNEAVEISSITFAMAGSGNESTDLTSALLYEDVDNDGQLNVLNDRQIGSTLTSFTDNGNLVFSGISEIIDAGNNENWLVVYNLNGSASNGETFQVKLEGNGAVVDTGVTSGEAITTTGAPIESGIATVSLTGALSLSEGSANPAAHNISDDEQNLAMLQLNLSASATEAVDISSIVFSTSGTGNENVDIDSVKLYMDINNNGEYDFAIDSQIGSTITSLSDNGAFTFGSLSEQISAAENENWLVIYYLNGKAVNDETFRVYINENIDVTATGATSLNSITPSGAPVQGGIMTVSTIGALTMALGTNDPGDENINGGAQNVTMLQLNLTASSVEDIQINSILITPTGSGLVRTEIVDPEIRIYRDVNNNGVYESAIDELITTANYGGSIYGVPPPTTVSLSEIIYAGTTENWLIVHTYSGGDVDNYLEIGVLQNSDISGTGITSSSSVSVTGASVQGGRKTVVAGTTPGTLTLSVGGNDPGYRNIAGDATDEVMFQMLLSAGSNEAVEISSITFAMTGSGNESTDLTSVLLYEDVDNDGQLNVLNDNQIGSTLTSFTDNGSLVFNGISEIINAGSSENWLVVYNLNGSASNGETFQVKLEGNGAVVDTGVTSGEAITTTGAPIESGIATVSLTGALTLSEGSANPAAHNIASDEQNLEMLQLNLSASATEAVDISSIVFSTSGTGNENVDVDSVKLYLDVNNNGEYDFGIDSQIGSTITNSADNGTLTFGSLSEQISAAQNENWLIIYYLNGTAGNNETFRAYLNANTDVTATGATSSNSIIPSGAPVQGSIMTVSNVGALTMALGANDPGNENINGAAQNVSMLQLNLTASSVEDIQINSILITPTGSGLVRTEIVDPEIRIYRDVNNNGVYESATDQLITTADYGGSIYGVPPATTVSLSEVIYAGTSENWLIVHTYSGGDVDDYLEIGVLQNSDISGTGITSAQSVSVTGASIQGGRKTVVSGMVPGTLSLSVGGDDPGYRNIATDATDEVMFQMLLSAGSNEAVEISSVTFAMAGSGNESTDLTSVLLYEDVDNDGQLNILNDNQIGSTLTSFTDNGNLVFNGISEIINAGNSENWLVVYNLNGSASNSETFQVKLEGNGAVVDTGVTSGEAITTTGAPIESGIATVSITGALTLSVGSNNPPAHTISSDEQDLEMFQLKLAANSTEDIKITAISFNTSGTANEAADLDSVKLYVDVNNNGNFDSAFDTQIGSTVTAFTDNGLITFSGLSDTVAASTTKNMLVVYYLNGTAANDETFRISVNDASQVTAQGITSTNTIYPTGTPVNGNTMTVSPVGALTMSLAPNNQGAQNISGNASNVVMMALQLDASSVEDLVITSIHLTAAGSGLVRTEIVDPEVNIYNDVNKNGVYDAATDQFLASQNYGGSIYAVPSSATVTIDSFIITAGTSVNWLIVHSFSGGDVDNYLEVSILQNSDISGFGSTSQSAMNVAGASVNGGRKTVVSGSTPGTLTLSAGSNNPEYRYISKGAQNEVMIQLQLEASPVENIQVYSIKFATSGSGNESVDLDSARLYLDVDNNGQFGSVTDTQIGSTISSFIDNDTLCFNNLSEIINAGTAQNWIIVYNLNSAQNSVGETFKVILSGNNAVVDTGVTSGQAIIPTGAPVEGGEAVISEIGTLTIAAGSSNPGNTNISNNETDLEVIQVALSAGNNEDVAVSSITFNITGTFNDTTDFTSSSIQLFLDDNGNGIYDAGDSQIGTNQSWSDDNGTVTFSGLNETIISNTTENWLLVCDLSGSASNGENFRASINSNTNISASGVTTLESITATGAPVNGGLFTISNTGNLTLALGTNNPAASSESAAAQNLEMIQLRLTASPVERIAVNSITFTADGTGDDLVDLNGAGNGVSLYRDLNNNGVLDAGDTQIDIQRTYSANNGTVTFTTTGDTIEAGSSENWLVVYDLDGSASEGETFRTGIYNSADITAVGVTSAQSITAGGTPAVGNFKTISTTGSISLAAGDNNPSSAYIDNTLLNDIEMLQFKLTTSTVEAVDVTQVVITHQGSGTPASDLTNARLIHDADNNGIYSIVTDNILATTTFSGASATFTLSGVSIPADSTENWLVIYNYTSGISNETTYIASIQSAADITASGAVSLNSITAGGSYPISGGTQTMTAYATLSVSGTDLSPASTLPGTENAGLMMLSLVTDKDTAHINSIRVDNRAATGTVAASDVDSIKIFVEDGTTAGFQAAEDSLIGGEPVIDDGSGGYAVVSLGSGLDVTTAGKNVYIAFDIAASANTANSVGVRINSTSYFNVTYYTLLNSSDFPIQSSQDYSLPVVMSSFTAAEGQGCIDLEWITESEIRNLGFILERKGGDDTLYAVYASYKTNEALSGQGSTSMQTVYAYKDNNVKGGVTYSYRLIQVDINGNQYVVPMSVSAKAALPKDFALHQNYPNPFNPTTNIKYELPEAARVNLTIYDILGRVVVELVDDVQEAGFYKAKWDGKNKHGQTIASGMYIFRIMTKGKVSDKNFVKTKKCMFLK
jgi:hypothetical protein